jgi:hypothetical protein
LITRKVLQRRLGQATDGTSTICWFASRQGFHVFAPIIGQPERRGLSAMNV